MRFAEPPGAHDDEPNFVEATRVLLAAWRRQMPAPPAAAKPVAGR